METERNYFVKGYTEGETHRSQATVGFSLQSHSYPYLEGPVSDEPYSKVNQYSLVEELREFLPGWPLSIAEWTKSVNPLISIRTPESIDILLSPRSKSYSIMGLGNIMGVGKIRLPKRIITIRSLSDYFLTDEFRLYVTHYYLHYKGLFESILENPDLWRINPLLRKTLEEYKPTSYTKVIEAGKKLILGETVTSLESELLYNYIMKSGYYYDTRLRNTWLSLLLLNQ